MLKNMKRQAPAIAPVDRTVSGFGDGVADRQPEVRRATVDELPQLTRTLADAFIDDPVYAWMLPGGRWRRSRLQVMFSAELAQYVLRNRGTVWTTSACDGAVAELPPDVWEMPKSMSLTDALTWVRAFGTRLPRATRVQLALEEEHLREPHIYVRLVGVRTALQGQGRGSALMQPTLQGADHAGLATYIEATSIRSAALYERLGFRHIGVLNLPDGGPPIWRMRRPPTRSAHRAADPGA